MFREMPNPKSWMASVNRNVDAENHRDRRTDSLRLTETITIRARKSVGETRICPAPPSALCSINHASSAGGRA